MHIFSDPWKLLIYVYFNFKNLVIKCDHTDGSNLTTLPTVLIC